MRDYPWRGNPVVEGDSAVAAHQYVASKNKPEDVLAEAIPGYESIPGFEPHDRLVLWDKYFHPIWVSDTATTPACAHIATWVHATIDKPDGTRWVGQLYRCPEGIKRWSINDLSVLDQASDDVGRKDE
jgi:hypothetical protein